MTALRPSEIDPFLDKGCRRARLILVHGTDDGTIRLRAKRIILTVLGPNADPLSRVELDADQINADPPLLADEARAISMFGDERIVVVNNAGKVNKAIWQACLAEPPEGTTLLFIAGDLAKSAALRVAFEESRAAAVLACYPPQRNDVAELFDRHLADAGLSASPPARAHMLDLLTSDLAIADSEIRKLMLYAHGRLGIDLPDIDAIIAESSSDLVSEAIDRAFDGKLEHIEAPLLRSFREGINPGGVLALAQTHALLLRRLVAAREANALDAALRNERIFFRRQDRIRGQAQRWAGASLAKAIDILQTAQEQSRLQTALGEEITIRALWAIALASRRL